MQEVFLFFVFAFFSFFFLRTGTVQNSTSADSFNCSAKMCLPEFFDLFTYQNIAFYIWIENRDISLLPSFFFSFSVLFSANLTKFIQKAFQTEFQNLKETENTIYLLLSFYQINSNASYVQIYWKYCKSHIMQTYFG